MAEKGTTKKTSATGSSKKVVRSTPTHPKTSEMVLAAVTALKDRKGTSLSAIKKYLSSTYKVDTDRTAIFIRRYLKKAVTDGVLVQVKGNGAAGSFKLPSAEKKPAAAAKSGSGKKRGRPAKTAAAEGKKKAATPKKAKKQGTVAKKAAAAKKTGATSAKKPKVKSAATTKKKAAGRPKSVKKATPKKKK
ncbi:MAG: histone H1/H5 family protein [Colwellia sp.]|nr:histone H1/H5 family protein [Colwellia sp.]